MRKLALVLPLLLTGCPHEECHQVYHDDIRHKYFMECLTAQKQPDHNREDDNGHMIEACDRAASYQSTEFLCKEVQ